MNTYVGVEVQLYTFLTSALGESEWSASHTANFIYMERASDTHWIRNWAGFRASLDTAGN
jgi:hypothetical protein